MANRLHTASNLEGRSGVRALLRDLDWRASPLGAPDTWPPALTTAVSMTLSSSFPMFVAWGAELGFVYNDAYAAILGDKHPAGLGQPFQRVWPEIWSDIVPIVDKALSDKSAYFEDLPLTIVRKGYPEQAHFTFSYSPLHDGDGQVAGMYCTVIETTDRVLAERRADFELKVSDALRPLTAPDQVVATASALLGEQMGLSDVMYGQVDAEGAYFDVINHWRREGAPVPRGVRFRRDDFGAAIGAALDAGEVIRIDDTGTDPRTAALGAYADNGLGACIIVPLVKGGRLVACLSISRAAPYRWSAADVRLTRDMAERTWSALETVHAQAELRQERDRSKLAADKLKEADQRKDEFLAMLAHELRNPLAPISAAAELLKIGKLDDARVRQSSAIIARQVKHMTSLVDDLLDVSRVTRGLVTLAQSPVEARTILDEAVEQVRPMLQARRQALTLYLPDEGATVLGDKARLVQVLANLLGNAAKYTPEGRGIEARAEVRTGELVLTVRDEGIGMDAALTARVFDLFAQAERSSDRSQGGLGLGLALVKHLVELHGGTVGCSSPGMGRGSTFEVRLPLMRAPAVPAAAPAPAVGLGRGECLKLMVVDDNADAAATLAGLLEADGHEVIVENESRRALARAHADAPDACLLDIGLPEIDGNELARRLRADPATAAMVLIAVTGYGQEQDRRAAFEAGFDHHLVKPVDLERLSAALAGVRRGRPQRAPGAGAPAAGTPAAGTPAAA